MKKGWKAASFLHKAVSVISILSGIVIVIFALLQIFGIWENAVNICIPLMGVQLLCQAHTQWNSNRGVAYFSIGAAVFIFICAIVVFFVK